MRRNIGKPVVTLSVPRLRPQPLDRMGNGRADIPHEGAATAAGRQSST